MTKWHVGRRRFLLSSAATSAAFAMPGIIRANAADATINKWLDEFQPSTLSRDAQLQELTWFQEAAKPFKGMDIKVVSETIDSTRSGLAATARSEISRRRASGMKGPR